MRLALVVVSSVFATACGTSTSKVAPCTGICAVGSYCDEVLGKCVAVGGAGGGSSASGGGGGSSATGGGGGSVSGMPCDVASVLAAKCVSCHAATPVGGAPNSLVTRADLLARNGGGVTWAERSLARMKDTSSPMPPAYTGDTASSADVAAMEAWINAGFPGGLCSGAGTGGGGGSMTGGGGGSVSGGGGGSVSGGGGGSVSGGGGGSVSGGGGGSVTGGGGGGSVTGGGGGSVTGGGGGSATGGGGGSASAYCRACAADSDCGGGSNFCIGFSFGDFCGVDCSSSTCGSGQRCANIVDQNNTVIGRNCVPVTGSTCSTGTGGGGGASGGGGGTTGGGGGTTGGGGGGSSCTTDTWASYGQSFFASKCSSCHHHSGQFSTRTSVVNARTSITSRINSGNMPAAPTTITAAEKTRIMQYLNCGVP